MIIYKVATNYHKGIEPFRIESTNDDGTFNYRCEIAPFKGRIFKKDFISEHPNKPSFFLFKKDAKEFLIKRIKQKIEGLEDKIAKANNTLNSLQ